MKRDIIIPESWSEVLWSDYSKYYNGIKPYVGLEEYSTKVLERAVLHLCHVSADELWRLDQSQFDTISNGISQLLGNSDKPTLVKEFTIGDTQFAFEPDLNRMTYGMYCDLVSYSKDTWSNIPIIMSILYRRQLGKDRWGRYEIEPYVGTNDTIIELFRDKLTMDIVFGAINFFFLLLEKLLSDTLEYSVKVMKDQEGVDSELETHLTKNGLSISHLYDLVETIQHG